ncbi:MAG: hypothetical protein ACRDFB_06145 [Rhabdochlamydiaceae bacterium]
MSNWDGEKYKIANLDMEPTTFNDDGSSRISIIYNFPMGYGSNSDQESALVRPFRKVIREGKPIGKISYLFFKDGNEHRVLGSFAYTGKRILYFPSITDRRLTFYSDERYNITENTLHIDHFSLESNLRTWHWTLLEKKEKSIRMTTQNTKRITSSLFRWFVMGIQSIDRLESMPEKQGIIVNSHSGDISRRVSIILDSMKKSIFQVTEVRDKVESPYFIIFEFFISTNQLPDFPDVKVFDLRGTSATIEDKRSEVLTRNHRIFLRGFSGTIWVRVSKIRGSIPSHAIFVSGHELKNFNEGVT